MVTLTTWRRAFVWLIAFKVACSTCSALGVAVKPGQAEVDAEKLPFAALTVTTDGGALPIQRIVLQNVATHKNVVVMLANSFSDKIEYLAAKEGDRVHAQIIVALPPGRYEMRGIDFNILRHGSHGSFNIDLTKVGKYVLQVDPGAVNFCGSVVITADWSQIRKLRAGEHHPLRTFVTVAPTQQRDMKWALDVIPGLRDIPSTASTITAEAGTIANEENQQPIAISRPIPEFPLELKKAGVFGTVVVDFNIDTDGHVVNAKVASSPDERLNATAVAAVSRWRFRPGFKNGKPVMTHLQVPITFGPQ